MGIDITNLPKEDILLTLYNNAGFKGPDFPKQTLMHTLFRMNPYGKLEKAREAIKNLIVTILTMSI